MLWRIVSFLLGVFVFVVVLNLIFGFISIAPVGQIISALVAIALIVFAVNMIRRAAA